MSLVGPRPERPFFVEQFKGEIRHYDARHRVPVGLTGLAQVHGLRGDTSIGERARFDNRYIESWSLWRDLVILVQTISAVIRDAMSSSPERQAAKRPVALNTRDTEQGSLQPGAVTEDVSAWCESEWDQAVSAG
jgi:hypothetical protein